VVEVDYPLVVEVLVVEHPKEPILAVEILEEEADNCCSNL